MKNMLQQLKKWTAVWVSLATALIGCALFSLSHRLEQEFLVSGSENYVATGWSKFLESASRKDLLHGLELTLFDWRAQWAAKYAPPIEPNLGMVVAQDSTIMSLRLGYPLKTPMGLLFPRKVYGRVLRELAAQGAKVVAFDVLLSEARPDHDALEIANGMTNFVKSDSFFAEQIRAQGQVVLASLPDQPPAPAFRNAAHVFGGVDSPRDVDGSARRIRAFAECDFLGKDLVNRATAKLRRTVKLSTKHSHTIELENPFTHEIDLLPIDSDGNVTLKVGAATLSVPALEHRRVWHMGIVLAAIQLGLDLDHAEIQPGRIILRGTNDLKNTRIIPVDAGLTMPIDWCVSMAGIPTNRVEILEKVLLQDVERQANPEAVTNAEWKDKTVVIGSIATGNNLTDIGTTPLRSDGDFLVTTYINVANAILQDRYVHRWPFAAELAIQFALALTGGILTWKLRTSLAFLSVLAIVITYGLGSAAAYISYGRLWLPVIHPLVTGLLLNHGVMVTWRVLFEQKERQRVKSVFSKIVSPDVVLELLKAERVGLGGLRRKLTVFFADIRGFTEMTDRYQVAAEEYVRSHGLVDKAADAYFEQQASEVLATVNLYLATIADVVKSHGGTLDKYIGDCVMAFWGAPTLDPQHAVNCVRAAIQAQRNMQVLNEQRGAENSRREEENKIRAAAGQEALPMLTQLALGTGINSGTMTVGLMGSDAHILNYTVFGREVNLASRLESVSGRSRIIIGQETYADLLLFTPELAATCIPQDPVTVKGFRQAVQVYEVPWRQAPAAAAPTAPVGAGSTKT